MLMVIAGVKENKRDKGVILWNDEVVVKWRRKVFHKWIMAGGSQLFGVSQKVMMTRRDWCKRRLWILIGGDMRWESECFKEEDSLLWKKWKGSWKKLLSILLLLMYKDFFCCQMREVFFFRENSVRRGPFN